MYCNLEVIDGYVTKDELYRLISNIKMNPDRVVDDKTCSTIVEAISDMPIADVQPVNRWISVDEALPEIDKPVLVYYQYYWGKGDIAKECGISKYYNRGKWSTLNIPIDSDVLYWQPLPEPPKEG